MFDVRFHGRGGQGVVTAAEMLSVAAFDSGLHAQAIPTFGSERTGAPVVSYCRISEIPIRYHEPVDRPDAIVVQDPTLLSVVPVLDGAGPTTYILINSSRAVDEIDLSPGADGTARERVVTIAAGDLARSVLGRPLPNTALLGALAALTGVISLEALVEAIRQRFTPSLAQDNIEVATRAHAATRARFDQSEAVNRA